MSLQSYDPAPSEDALARWLGADDTFLVVGDAVTEVAITEYGLQTFESRRALTARGQLTQYGRRCSGCTSAGGKKS